MHTSRKHISVYLCICMYIYEYVESVKAHASHPTRSRGSTVISAAHTLDLRFLNRRAYVVRQRRDVVQEGTVNQKGVHGMLDLSRNPLKGSQ